jgi:hypothetical protein
MQLKTLVNPRICAIIAMVCPVLLLMLPSVAAPALTDFDPLWTLISVMALEDFGWLGIIFFVISAMTVLAFAGGLYGSLVPDRKTITAVKLMCAASVCLVLLAFIDIDHVHGVWSFKRAVHWSIVTMGMATFLTACYLITSVLKHDQTWRGMYIFTIVIAILCVVTGIILAATVRAGFVALAERLVLTAGVIWVEVISLKIIRMSVSKTALDSGG